MQRLRVPPLHKDHPGSVTVSPLVRLWLLRLLVPYGLHKKFIGSGEFLDDEIAVAVGLGEQFELPTWDFNATELRGRLRKLHQEAERSKDAAKPPEKLVKNIAHLRNLLNLSDVDCRIVEFVVMQRNEPLLNKLEELLGELNAAKLFRVLSAVLGLSEFDVRTSLGNKGILARSGLISVDENPYSLRYKIELLRGGFADAMLSSSIDPVEMVRDRVMTCSQPQLKLEDYAHVSQSIKILRPYLRHATDNRCKGVNIYIHGPPGTGKTELAKVLAQEIGSELFQVASEDRDGDPVRGKERLKALQAAQCFFSQGKYLILFDEAEDAFDDGDMFTGSAAQVRKAWVNRMLEENPVPVLWLSNSIYLDPAFIRRFDMVIEMPIPPRQQRKQIVRRVCGELVNADTVERIADAESMSPSVIARAAAVLRCIEGGMGKGQVSSAIEHLVSSTLEAQGHRPLDWYANKRITGAYVPAFVNADIDLPALIDGMAQARAGRMCLYGPPGTGKTAFGHWMARQLDIPLLVKRGSDMIAPYVGETEQNIARAFREAEREKALLLIDEVDSFLQDRRGAHHSWEVTAVNEMLTQMESFTGIFIASTNLMGNLDQAALRRFDLKVKFDYLRPEQAWQMLLRQCESFGIPAPSESHRIELSRLAALTPGDFAAMARQHRFHPITDAAGLISALKQECVMKEGGNRMTIGFVG